MGRGWIQAALFDLGIYPAAIPANDDTRVWGEVHQMLDSDAVLALPGRNRGLQRGASRTPASTPASRRR